MGSVTDLERLRVHEIGEDGARRIVAVRDPAFFGLDRRQVPERLAGKLRERSFLARVGLFLANCWAALREAWEETRWLP
jgi:hypothetical protein